MAIRLRRQKSRKKSGLVLWSISQTGGMIFRPLSQVADETVQLAAKELQAKIR